MEGSSFLKRLKKEYATGSPPPEQETFMQRMRKEESERDKTLEPIAFSPMGKVGSKILGMNTQGELNRVGDRIKNIGKLWELSQRISLGAKLSPNQEILATTVKDAFVETTKSKVKVVDQLLNSDKMFENVDVKQSVKAVFGNIKEMFSAEGAGSLMSLPVGMITSIATDAFGATTGLDLSGKEIKKLNPEEADRAVRYTVGNILASAITPSVSKMMKSTSEREIAKLVGKDFATDGTRLALPRAGAAEPVIGKMVKAPLENVAKVAEMAPPETLGKIGQAMLADVTAAGAAGATQGAIGNTGTPEALSAMVTGLMFAPIGILTGWYRGIVQPNAIETAIMRAHQVKNLRLWQELDNANLESTAKKASDLLTSETIEQAIGLPEGISAAAIKTPAGRVVEGFSHMEAARNLTQEELKGRMGYNWHLYQDGYVTTQGKFVDRIDAEDVIQNREQFDWKNAKPKYGQGLVGGLHHNDITGYAPKTDINTLYNLFKETLTENKTFDVSLAEFAQKHNLTKHIPELTDKFSMKFAMEDELHPQLTQMLSSMEDQRKMGKFSPPDILDVADRHSVFFTNEFGRIVIRDIESGGVLGTAYNTQEAIEIMGQMGKHPNPIYLDAGSNLPTPKIGPHIAPISQPHLVGWEPESTVRQWKIAGFKIPDMKRVFEAFDLKMHQFTGQNAYLEAVDQIDRALPNETPIHTDFKTKVFLELERIKRNDIYETKRNLNNPKRLEMIAYAEKHGITDIERETAAHLLETSTPDDIRRPNGYTPGFTLSKEGDALAQFAFDNNIDLPKLQQYRNQQIAVRAQFRERARARAVAEHDMNTLANIPKEDANALMIKTMGDFEKTPAFVAQMQRIDNVFGVDQNFIKATKMMEVIYAKVNGSTNMAAATRLKLALDDPERFGMSEAAYIKFHKVRPEVVEVANQLRNLYKSFGSQFGIPDSGMLMRYMNHYRQVGDITNHYMINEFEAGIMDPSMKQFASAMVRTGEIANYSMDPFSNLDSYIRGGTKARNGGIYHAINEMKKLDGPLWKELDKITNTTAKDLVTTRLEGYFRDLTGQTSMSEKQWQSIQIDYLKDTIVDQTTGKKMSTADIIKKMQDPAMIDTMMAFSSSGLLGGRISLMMRDNLDLWIKFSTKHGYKRFSQLMTTRVPKARIAELERQGEVVVIEGVDAYAITHSEMNKAAKTVSQLGYKTSLQSWAYVRNQAAVFDHTMKFTIDVLSDMDRKVISSKSAAYKKLGMNNYAEGVQRLFDAAVTDHNYEFASRILAREEVREMAGYMTKGNQATILNSRPGRMFGQLGSWGMTNRSVLQNLLTRGTKEELRAKHIRYAMNNLTIAAVGAAAGVNLGRWLLLPTSVLNTGGPVLGSLQALSGAVASNAGGSEAQTRFTNRALETAAKQFIPFSYAATDVVKGVDLVTHGEGYGPRAAAQAIGIQTNKEDGTFLDWWMGTQPVHWADPTPFNINPLAKLNKWAPMGSKPINLNPFD